MPELPEVETVRQGLLPALKGCRIVHADVRRAGLRWPFPPDFAQRLKGAQVLDLRRRSKYLLIDLTHLEGALAKGRRAPDTPDQTLLIHLGMSGRMQVLSPDTSLPAKLGAFHHALAPLEKHDHVVFYLDSGAAITFNDARRFGAMDLIPTATLETHPLLAKLGPEPLSNAFNASALGARLAGKTTSIKAALLDQHIVAGLGNIYVCEALFATGIHPKTPAGALSETSLENLVAAIREVLDKAIAAGGSSLRDHRQTNGSLGYFQHHFQVYNREGQPCHTPGCSGHIQRLAQGGRSSFLCPICQSYAPAL